MSYNKNVYNTYQIECERHFSKTTFINKNPNYEHNTAHRSVFRNGFSYLYNTN